MAKIATVVGNFFADLGKNLTSEKKAESANHQSGYNNDTNFFEDLRERLSGPFISSFVVTWLVVNWRVTIVLFWYTREDLRKDGYENYIDFITDETSWCSNLVWPFIFSFLYCFVYPVAVEVIKLVRAKIRIASNKQMDVITNEAPLSMANYLALRDTYQRSISQLKKIYSEESDLIKKVENLELDITKIRGEKDNTESRLKSRQNKVEYLEGKVKELEVDRDRARKAMRTMSNDLTKNVIYGVWGVTVEFSSDRKLTYQISIPDKFSIPDINTGILQDMKFERFFNNLNDQELLIILIEEPTSDYKEWILRLSYDSGYNILRGILLYPKGEILNIKLEVPSPSIDVGGGYTLG